MSVNQISNTYRNISGVLPQKTQQPPAQLHTNPNKALPPYIQVKTPSGKVFVMPTQEYIRIMQILQQQKPKPAPIKVVPYQLGEELDGVRTITEHNVSNPFTRGSADEKLSPDKKTEFAENIAENNGQIDKFLQGRRGDCYLLSSLEAIKYTKDGQKILAKNIQVNSDGSLTVILPGAIAVKNELKKEENSEKCAITGRYHITKEALEKAKTMSGKAYAYGDIDVIAIELAMEAFRAESAQTMKDMQLKREKYVAGQDGYICLSDTLSGGQMYDAIFMLTGATSDLYEAPKEKFKNPKLYIQGEFGFIPSPNSHYLKSNLLGKAYNKIIEVDNVYNKDSDLQKMLDKYQGKESEYAITVGVRVGKKGPDGYTKAGGGHALTVSKITDKYVEIINPWNTTRRERIPRGTFEKMALNLCVTKMSLDKIDNFYEKVNSK